MDGKTTDYIKRIFEKEGVRNWDGGTKWQATTLMSIQPTLALAYWFKHDLSRIMRRLTEKKIPFEKLDSEESIRKWNRGELPVALIHPASAGHGLNLQLGGNTLIWFGLTWSLELYQQTVARLWRQGQTAETVVVQHIITAGTIDEDVMKALANKDMTQNRLIAAVKARVTHGR